MKLVKQSLVYESYTLNTI